jgi:hypothetical protein
MFLPGEDIEGTDSRSGVKVADEKSHMPHQHKNREKEAPARTLVSGSVRRAHHQKNSHNNYNGSAYFVTSIAK